MTDPIAVQYRDMAYASNEVWVIQMWDAMNNQIYRKSQEIERLRTEILKARRNGSIPEAFPHPSQSNPTFCEHVRCNLCSPEPQPGEHT